MEARVTPSATVKVGPTVADLIAAIGTADQQAGPQVLVLQPGATYKLTAVNNNWYGPNGLPPIDNAITIVGNGDTIGAARRRARRSSGSSMSQGGSSCPPAT